MTSITRVPVMLAVFAVITMLLSGCIAYDVASTAVDAGATVVSTAGDIVTSPFGGDDSAGKKSK